jgi:hypothetical protein
MEDQIIESAYHSMLKYSKTVWQPYNFQRPIGDNVAMVAMFKNIPLQIFSKMHQISKENSGCKFFSQIKV